MNCPKIFTQGENLMLNFNKNKLIDQTLERYFETFSHTLDTVDYVPEKYTQKINKYIFKNMKKAFRRIDREDRKFQRKFKKNVKAKEKLLKNKAKHKNSE